MSLTGLPPTAAWQHRHARDGFEVAYLEVHGERHRFVGCTTATEAGETWIVDYDIVLNDCWHTLRASLVCRSAGGVSRTVLEADGHGRWHIDGVIAPGLDGCLDVDLESSALTNAFPVNRLKLEVGQHAAAPAAFVRVDSLTVERLQQHYARIENGTRGQRYDYTAPTFDFSCRLRYDESGLLLAYPGIADRIV